MAATAHVNMVSGIRPIQWPESVPHQDRRLQYVQDTAPGSLTELAPGCCRLATSRHRPGRVDRGRPAPFVHHVHGLGCEPPACSADAVAMLSGSPSLDGNALTGSGLVAEQDIAR